mmetsp:Transcript_43655/g.132125  ORF Transcript_43655/g.132125 Transcript_43655/m.132125 type:complete len:270 (-) Transcript_43655:356-1165(-)
MPMPEKIRAQPWHKRLRKVLRGKLSGITCSSAAGASRPRFSKHMVRSRSPSSRVSSMTGTGGKPQLHVRRKTCRLPLSDSSPPRRFMGSGPLKLLMTRTASAPAWWARKAFHAKGANSPLELPRSTSTKLPSATAASNAFRPWALPSSYTTLPRRTSPAHSPFHDARWARKVVVSEPRPLIVMGCRSSGIGSSGASCEGSSRMRFSRSSSSSIMAMSGRVFSMTSSTSRGARGEIWIVATRNISLGPWRTYPHVYGTSSFGPSRAPYAR